MRLINPRGRIVSVREPLASYYASRDGWRVLSNEAEQTREVKKSTECTTREAVELAKSMTDEQLADFIEGDERKTIQKLL